MTHQPSENDHLRSIARDVRFLTYRAGNPNPLARLIFFALVAPLALIIAATFFVEIGIQFGWMKPVHRRTTPQRHELIRRLSHNPERGNSL